MGAVMDDGKPLYIGQDNLIEWRFMLNAATEEYVNDATVTFTVKDSDGNTVASGSMSYLAASDGIYQGVVPDDTDLDDGDTYTIEVTGISGTSKGLRKFTREAMYQGAEC